MMGRRRKRKMKVARPKRVIPKIFQCPHCGKSTLTVEISRGSGEADVRCGFCGLHYKTVIPQIFQPVDVYARFLDEYHSGEAEIIFEKSEAEAQEEQV